MADDTPRFTIRDANEKFGQRADEHRGQNPEVDIVLPSQEKPQSAPPTADPDPED